MDTDHTSPTTIEDDCIAACTACAASCERCAAVCLRENPSLLATLSALSRTCADVCLFTAKLIAQESTFAKEYCALCAEVCNAVRGECLKHEGIEACRHCAEHALRCDEMCQRLAV